MESEPVFAGLILDQLRTRNASELAFTNVIRDYQTLMQRNRDLQKRNGQLEKEANELRSENSMLSESANMTRMAAANAEEVTALKAECKKLQDQVNQLYEEKSKLSDKLLAESERLRIVRDNFERHDNILTERNNTIKDLKTKRKELQANIAQLTSAQTVSAEELKARCAENEKLSQQIRSLESDNKELTERLVEMKSTEIERMNEVNRICNEMMQNAKNMERAAAAEANSAPQKVIGRLFGSRQSRTSNDLAAPDDLMGQLREVSRRTTLTESQVPEGQARTFAVHEGGCYALTFNRSGSVLASAGADKAVRLWEPSSAQQTSQLNETQELVLDLSFNCDQNHLLTAGSDKSLKMWNLSSGRTRHTLTGHSDKVSGVSCSPVDEKLAASGSMDRSIKTWDLHKGYVAGSFLHASKCHSVKFTMDGSLLASGHLNGSLCFWDKRSHKSVHEIAGLHGTTQIVSLAMGGRSGVVLTCGKDHVLKLVDVRSFQVQKTMKAPGFNVGTTWCSATISADERHVACGSADGQTFIWETHNGRLVKAIGGGRGASGVLASCWSPQGTPLVTSERNGNVSFWQ